MSEKLLTHYQVLGLARTATEREIKIAYRKAARISHPDTGGDAARFRQITEAYEVLSNPARRQAYDRSYGTSEPLRGQGQSGSGSSGSGSSGSGQEGNGTNRGSRGYGPAASGGFTAGSSSRGFENFTTRRAGGQRSTAANPARYVPAYEDVPVGEAPLLPRTTAAQPVHGVPRKRGVFGASSRLAREAKTAQLIMQQILPGIAAARLINGLTAPASNGYLDHVLVSGYRIAIVGSMLVPDGAFRWDGSMLTHGSRVVAPPELIQATRQFQNLFPECNVTAWVCVHSNSGNLFEPVIDYARGTEPDGSNLVNVANAARFVRETKAFLAAGPAPNVVDLHVLGRLLGGMY